MTVYILQQPSFNYDDEYHQATDPNEAGQPVKAYKTRAAAEAAARVLKMELDKKYSSRVESEQSIRVAIIPMEITAGKKGVDERGTREEYTAAAATVFAEHPKLKSFAFEAYTPYFNDGDTCEYGIHLDEPIINEVRSYDYTEEELEDGRDFVDGKFKKNGKPQGWVYLAVQAIQKAFSKFSKTQCVMAFGDHVQVTFKRSSGKAGATVKTVAYDHD